MEQPNPLTTSYLHTLSILFSPIPSLSSSTSISLSQQLPQGLNKISKLTKCNKCFNEIIGGLNGSVRNGMMYCEGCRWVSKIDSGEGVGEKEEEGLGLKKRGKGSYGKVKRRKLNSQVVVVEEVVASTRVVVEGMKGKGKEVMESKSTSSITSTNPSISISMTTLSSQPQPPSPSQSSTRLSPATTSSASTTSKKPTKPIPFSHKPVSTSLSTSSSSSIPSLPSFLPPPPSSVPISKPPSIKSESKSIPPSSSQQPAQQKKKRQKQPGLAALLEAKKLREASGSTGVGGLGLSDFLQGI